MRVAAFKFRIQISLAGPQIGNHCLLVPNSDECGGLFFGNVDSDVFERDLQPLIQIKCYEFQIGNNRFELIDLREIIIFTFDSNNRHPRGALASGFSLIGRIVCYLNDSRTYETLLNCFLRLHCLFSAHSLLILSTLNEHPRST